MVRTPQEALIESIGVPVDSKFIRVGNCSTHYFQAGAGPAVVLVHGAGAGALTWYPVIGPLSAHYLVLAPDVPGYGESDKPCAKYDALFYAKWLASFLEAMGVRQARLVGSSQGGAIALHFALLHPQKVARLALVGSAGLGRVSLGGAIRLMWLNTLPSQAAQHALDRFLAFRPEFINPAWSDYSLESCRKPGGRRAFWLGMGRAVRPIDWESLHRISQPVLLIWGAAEKFFPPSQAYAAQKVLPRAELRMMADAGHLPFFDKPQQFNQAIMDFMGQTQDAPDNIKYTKEV